MLETIDYQDGSDFLLRTLPSGLTQRFSFEGVPVEINCEFVNDSFSDFTEPERYRHSDPGVSRLILVEQGRVSLETGHGRLVVQPGQIYLLPAGLSFTVEYLDHCITKGFHLNLFDGVKFSIAHDLNRIVILESSPLFEAVREAIRTECRPLIESTVTAAVVACLRDVFPILKERSAVPLLYRRILEDLKRTPPARIRLEDSARKFHITPAALSKGFSRLFGISWKKYQSRLILFQARNLLTGTSLTVAEIATELGFDDVNYFYVFFRRHSELSPLEYRKETMRQRP